MTVDINGLGIMDIKKLRQGDRFLMVRHSSLNPDEVVSVVRYEVKQIILHNDAICQKVDHLGLLLDGADDVLRLSRKQKYQADCLAVDSPKLMGILAQLRQGEACRAAAIRADAVAINRLAQLNRPAQRMR